MAPLSLAATDFKCRYAVIALYNSNGSASSRTLMELVG